MEKLFKQGMIWKIVVLFLCMAILPFAAQATENGGGAYPNGAEDSMSGAVPPPGVYVINYSTYYMADRLRDNHGNRLNIPFRLGAFADVVRVLYSSKVQLLGGNAGAHLFLPVVSMNVTTPAGKGSKAGIGDIEFAPFIAWHLPNFHAVAAIETIAPTGDFDKDKIANIGRNYWTFEPVLAFTYLSDGGIELSGKFMYDVNTKNTDTKYTSGNEFHVDYTAAYHYGPWTFGANGYFYKQITNDLLGGEKVGTDGYKGQVLAAGPMIKYDIAKNLGVTLKYQREMLVRNKPEGDKFWLKIFYAF
jgi:hypothetical protein